MFATLKCTESTLFATEFQAFYILPSLIVTLLLVIWLSDRPKCNNNAPVPLPGFSTFAFLSFFRRRFDFLNNGFRITGQPLFQFYLLTCTVIAVSGETGRNVFFGTRGFDLYEGFKVLSGAIPLVRGVTTDLQLSRMVTMHKRLAAVQKSASLSRLIPPILDDCQRIMDGYKQEGLFDPFEKVYELVFQVTVRSLSCSEIADDAILVARLKRLYDQMDSGTTPATVILPWFPSPGMISKLMATKAIYDIIIRAVDSRTQSGIAKNDTLQMLIDAGDDRMMILGFIMGLFIAGARATGTTASWLIMFLGCHPEWKAKAAQEIQNLLASHPLPTQLHPNQNYKPSLSTHLSMISVPAWESQTPILDGFIRETLRLAQPHIAMRRNVGPDVYIGDKVVPTGAYVLYPFSDVHLDPGIYEDPWRFDPGREGRKDNVEGSFDYVGWGAGTSICAGQRLAKIELKLIASMFLLGFDFSIVDHSGKPRNASTANSIPRPNWNDTLLCRPPEGSCYLKYERRAGVSL